MGLGLEAPGQEAAGGGWGLGFPAVRWGYQQHTPPRSAQDCQAVPERRQPACSPARVVIVTLTWGRAPDVLRKMSVVPGGLSPQRPPWPAVLGASSALAPHFPYSDQWGLFAGWPQGADCVHDISVEV